MKQEQESSLSKILKENLPHGVLKSQTPPPVSSVSGHEALKPKHHVHNKLKEFERNEVSERAQALSAKSMLRHAEQVFTEYFLSKVAPSQASEERRTQVFNMIQALIQQALGKYPVF